jgi:hypothetical protein
MFIPALPCAVAAAAAALSLIFLQVGARARDALQRIKDAADEQEATVGHAADAAEVLGALRQQAAAAAPAANLNGPLAAPVLAHVAAVGESLITAKLHSTRCVGVGGAGWLAGWVVGARSLALVD